MDTAFPTAGYLVGVLFALLFGFILWLIKKDTAETSASLTSIDNKVDGMERSMSDLRLDMSSKVDRCELSDVYGRLSAQEREMSKTQGYAEGLAKMMGQEPRQ